MTCLAVGSVVLALASPAFTLEWTHSVEIVTWHETWQVEPEGLRLIAARVKGSGAGMEPGDGATLADGWWVWAPGTTVDELHLAASGATASGWTFCADAACTLLGQRSGPPVHIAPCPPDGRVQTRVGSSLFPEARPGRKMTDDAFAESRP